MSKRLFIALSALFLIAASAYGRALQGRSSAAIDGSIILPTNQAMERYEILLLSKDGEQVISRTYTDLTGRYHFTGLSADNFDVVVRIEGFDEARVPVRLSPNKAMIVNIILTQKADTVVQPDQWDPSVVNIDELTRKYPKKAVDDFEKAFDSKHKGDPDKAMALLEGVLKIAPDFYDAHNLLGTVYQGMDRYRDAEKQYNSARNLTGTIEPLVNLATLYLQEAESNAKEGPLVTGVMYDDALHILQAAGRIDPHNAMVFYLIGVTFYRSHSDRIAEASFNEALTIDAHMGSARLALANIYIRQRNWKAALDEFDSYLEDNPKAADRGQVEAIRAKVIQQL